LKKPRFRRSLAAVRDALRFQADLHIASAAASAAKYLQSAVTSPSPDHDPLNPETAERLARQLKSLTDLLRLAHVRDRFSGATARPRHSDENDDRGGDAAACNTPPGADFLEPPEMLAEMFAEPERLKAYFCLLAGREHPEYEPFLAGFPDDLKIAREMRADYLARKAEEARRDQSKT
jgi:hypothetical protein